FRCSASSERRARRSTGQRRKLGRVSLPVRAVELLRDAHRFHRRGIEAARVDADPVRMRARHIERLDSADAAEQVLRDAGIEAIAREHVLPREQAEARFRDDIVQKARHSTDRAVALDDVELVRAFDREANAAAVTAAVVERHSDDLCCAAAFASTTGLEPLRPSQISAALRTYAMFSRPIHAIQLSASSSASPTGRNEATNSTTSAIGCPRTDAMTARSPRNAISSPTTKLIPVSSKPVSGIQSPSIH